MRKLWKLCWPCWVICLSFYCPQSWAASTEVFVDQGASAFSQGEFEETLLDAFGMVRPGLGLQRFPYDAVEGFSALATGSDGQVYVGTASGGAVLRFVKNRFEEVYRAEADDAEGEEGEEAADERVTAIAVTKAGVWAAFAPSGRLIRVDEDGKVKTVEGLESAYIWRMEGRADGGVTVATGAPGGVAYVDARGKVRKDEHDIDELHVMDFLQVDGDLWIATAMPARVVRLGAHNQRSVLFELGDADETLKLIPAPDGGVYALTNKGAPTAKARGSKKGDGKKDKGAGASGHSKSAIDAFGPSEAAPKPLAAPKGASLWHVDARAAPRLVRSLGKQAVLSGAGIFEAPLASKMGGVLVGMSEQGRALGVDPKGDVTVLIDTAETGIQAFDVSAKGEGYFITIDGAALYRISSRSRRASFLSPVRDASVSVRVGRVDWVGEGVRVELRTGATANPIKGSWSQFAAISSGGGVPRVPAGRFIQYRVTFSSADAALRALRIAYRPPNRRPIVRSVEFVDRKTKVSSSDSSGNKKRMKGLRKAKKVLSSVKAKKYTGIKRIGFNVQDEDGDALRFDVRTRQIGSDHWTRLTPEQGAANPFVDWVVADFPDGRYEVEVVSSDADTNPPGDGLEGRAVSQPVLVDNHPPVIESAKVRSGRIEFSVRDAASPITNVQVAVDGGAWRAVAPVDGIIDGKQERFAVSLESFSAQTPALIRIGAEDSFGHRTVEGVYAR